MSYCTETPINTDLGWADKMIASAQANGTKLEVNENYYRVPTERIKREMILAGVFGKVNAAYNDFPRARLPRHRAYSELRWF